MNGKLTALVTNNKLSLEVLLLH